MSPAETYAQSRSDAETLIRQHAPARLQDAVIERLLPAIALAATRKGDAEIAVGASKFGGAPDVPEGFAWPLWNDLPLSFIAQINLTELAPFDIENRLPSSGLLSFFYCLNEDGDWPWGELDDVGGWRIFHFEGELKRADVPVEAQSPEMINTATIAPQIFCDVPNSLYWLATGLTATPAKNLVSRKRKKIESASGFWTVCRRKDARLKCLVIRSLFKMMRATKPCG